MKKIRQIFAQSNSNLLEIMIYDWYINGIKVLVVSESWPFSCPAPTVLLSRSFSFQSAFSSFSMVGITVNRTQQVLSRTALGCIIWHEKYILSNNIHLTTNYFLSLYSAFLLALIEEDIWGAEGQRLFVRLGEVWVFEWINIWTENNPRSASGENLRKFEGEESRLVKYLRAGRVSGAVWRAAFYSTCEGLNKIRQKKHPDPSEPIQQPK